MVEHSAQTLDVVFHALADPTRRAMLSSLSSSALTVGDLAEPFEISLNAASKHIKVLEQAGLIRREVEGRRHICHLNAQPMHAGMEWIRHYEKFWQSKLDILESLLVEEDRAAAQATRDRVKGDAK